eukprot:912979-Pyramimonas_sp.AAC.1
MMLAFLEVFRQAVLFLELGVAVLALMLPGFDTCRGIVLVPTSCSVPCTFHPNLERRVRARIYVGPSCSPTCHNTCIR